MKRLFAALVVSGSLLVAVPVASALPPLPPQAPTMANVSCSVSAGGTTQYFNFVLPSFAWNAFQQALARVQVNFPSLQCEIVS